MEKIKVKYAEILDGGLNKGFWVQAESYPLTQHRLTVAQLMADQLDNGGTLLPLRLKVSFDLGVEADRIELVPTTLTLV